jgi:hypothetical protein
MKEFLVVAGVLAFFFWMALQTSGVGPIVISWKVQP